MLYYIWLAKEHVMNMSVSLVLFIAGIPASAYPTATSFYSKPLAEHASNVKRVNNLVTMVQL